MAAAAATAMVASLPEDLLLEILFHLKDAPADLFRCAAACKRWRTLVAEPAFHRRCWPDQDASSSLAGFFTAHAAFSHLPTPCFTPTPRSVFGPSRRALTSFITSDPSGVFDRAMPLVSRHGLLLVRLDTYAVHGNLNSIILDLAVCNLLTGIWHTLPPLKFDSVVGDRKWNSYALLTGIDCCSNDEAVLRSATSIFKVAIFSSYNKDNMQSLHTYSSDQESWVLRSNCFDRIVHCYMGSSNRAVMRRGTAQWLFRCYGQLRLCIPKLNMRTGHIALTKIPFMMNLRCHPCLTLTLNGALSLLLLQKKRAQIEIWEQQEEQPNKDDGSEWVCTRKLKLNPLDERGNDERELCILGEKCGTLLINDTLKGIYTVNLDTGIMEEVVDWPHRSYTIPRDTVPLEVDWPSIFVSRLGTRYSWTL
ncbi:unnamed protein product [Alopecurus aequalis]